MGRLCDRLRRPNWIRSELKFPVAGEIIPVLITPCTSTTCGALPHLQGVRYWGLGAFRDWAKNALKVIRDIRRQFTGPGNLAWRQATAARLKVEGIAPESLRALLSQTAASAMTAISSDEEEA
jgi:hypothetical protein